jgi:hypothetical protein
MISAWDAPTGDFGVLAAGVLASRGISGAFATLSFQLAGPAKFEVGHDLAGRLLKAAGLNDLRRQYNGAKGGVKAAGSGAHRVA